MTEDKGWKLEFCLLLAILVSSLSLIMEKIVSTSQGLDLKGNNIKEIFFKYKTKNKTFKNSNILILAEKIPLGTSLHPQMHRGIYGQD